MIVNKKEFNELSLDELYSILKIRQEVFIVEQKCFYLDCDGLDKQAMHFLGVKNQKLIAYMRVVKTTNENREECLVLGRILVVKKQRELGIGYTFVENVITILNKKFPYFSMEMSAQTYLIDFYKKFNFKVFGEEYLDAGIPHIKMIKNN